MESRALNRTVTRYVTGFMPLAVLSILMIAAFIMMNAAAQNSALFGRMYSVLLLVNILGAVLLEVDPTAARQEFEAALRLAPGRSRALHGLVRASIAAGDKARAVRAVDQLADNWRLGDAAVREDLAALRRAVNRLP